MATGKTAGEKQGFSLGLLTLLLVFCFFSEAAAEQRTPEKPAPDPLWVQGKVLCEMGEYQKSLAFLMGLLPETPEAAQRAHILFWIGRAWEGTGDFDRAQEAYVKALEENPGLPELTRVLAAHQGEAIPLWDHVPSQKDVPPGLPEASKPPYKEQTVIQHVPVLPVMPHPGKIPATPPEEIPAYSQPPGVPPMQGELPPLPAPGIPVQTQTAALPLQPVQEGAPSFLVPPSAPLGTPASPGVPAQGTPLPVTMPPAQPDAAPAQPLLLPGSTAPYTPPAPPGTGNPAFPQTPQFAQAPRGNLPRPAPDLAPGSAPQKPLYVPPAPGGGTPEKREEAPHETPGKATPSPAVQLPKMDLTPLPGALEIPASGDTAVQMGSAVSPDISGDSAPVYTPPAPPENPSQEEETP